MSIKNNLPLVFSFVTLIISQVIATPKNDDIYIVYMGANNNENRDLILSTLLKSKQNSVVRKYEYGFSGFAARLSDKEAQTMAKQPGVVSVFKDPILQLQTTRSWDFLTSKSSLLFDFQQPPNHPLLPSQGSDTIIGIIDTGIWPESESFNVKDMGPIPSRWKGKCMEGPGFNASNCSKKLIGARYYNLAAGSGCTGSCLSARDEDGHGTHVASTAAGVSIANASYYSLANGTAKGGSPGSRIAVYRACYPNGCDGSIVLASFDDAIADGVDVLSVSLGFYSIDSPDFSTDPIAIGAFHAVQKGITVVCSAGNYGPSPKSLMNEAPWIFNVGATTIDRDLGSDIILGNGEIIQGESINFSELKESPIYPLTTGVAAKKENASEVKARSCNADSIDDEKIKGKIVLCYAVGDYEDDIRRKMDAIKHGGGVGIIVVNDARRLVAIYSGTFPMAMITSKEVVDILAYITATKNAVATILPTKTIPNYKPAPTIAVFSARGPPLSTKNLLKPDIVAPGVNILAAWKGNDTSNGTTPEGREPPLFNVLSGTSMSCPHVSGVVANIKSQYPTWSPAIIRSSIMTTATQTNNLKNAITTETGEVATPYDFGAGEMNPTGALQPGLVYDTDPVEYLHYLCYLGYSQTKIKLIAGELPTGYTCPNNSSIDKISNINYPSIAVSLNATTGSIQVKRTVTNIGNDIESVYKFSVDCPTGVEVNVNPYELIFTRDINRLDYNITFSTNSSVKGDFFGAITWRNNNHNVRSPFVVCIV